MISKQNQQAPWMIGAMILGALAASKNAETGNAMIVGGQALAAQNQLNFSRDMEREADRVGFGVMTQAGFEAQGFVSMFDKLQQASRLNDNGAYPYLRSHPLTSERIADMQARLPPGGAKTETVEPTLEHAMVAARAGVLSNPGVDALRTLHAHAGDAKLANESPARQVAILYGAALADLRLRDFTAAQTSLARLAVLVHADERASRLHRLLAAELALTADKPDVAAGWLSTPSNVKTSPNPKTRVQRPELFLWARLVIQSQGGMSVQEIRETTQQLQTWVGVHPRDAQAWQLLSSAYAAQGQNLRAIRADAESQVALLDYPAALNRLKAAQDFFRQGQRTNAPADHIEASIIDTRKRQVESRLKEQALER